MRSILLTLCSLATLFPLGYGQNRDRPSLGSIVAAHQDHVGQLIDQAVNPAQPPAGFKGLMIAYRDDLGALYKPYGVATVDGTVALDQHTLFGIGSLTKLFTATLLALASERGLALTTPLHTLIPSQYSIVPPAKRYSVRLVDLADHHSGLPKNAGHLLHSPADLYADFVADPITCESSTTELIHDCGCCNSDYMSLLGLPPSCGAGVANPVYACPVHAPTQGAQGFLYSNEAFEILGDTVGKWLGYTGWNDANWSEIASPLRLSDTMPLESFGPSQVARASNHCNPATRASNANCQLLDWLPAGNGGGGLFSTAQDMLQFAAYNAYGPFVDFGNLRLQLALPIVHQTYEQSPSGPMELGWQTEKLSTGEFARWKDGDNGPFHAWIGYVQFPNTRMIVLMVNSNAYSSDDLRKIGEQVLVGTAIH